MVNATHLLRRKWLKSLNIFFCFVYSVTYNLFYVLYCKFIIHKDKPIFVSFPNVSEWEHEVDIQYERNWGCYVTQQSFNRSKMAEDSGARNRHFSAKNRKCHNFDEGDSFHNSNYRKSRSSKSLCFTVSLSLPVFIDTLKVKNGTWTRVISVHGQIWPGVYQFAPESRSLMRWELT